MHAFPVHTQRFRLSPEWGLDDLQACVDWLTSATGQRYYPGNAAVIVTRLTFGHTVQRRLYLDLTAAENLSLVGPQIPAAVDDRLGADIVELSWEVRL